jgi:hypothetical protein
MFRKKSQVFPGFKKRKYPNPKANISQSVTLSQPIALTLADN